MDQLINFIVLKNNIMLLNKPNSRFSLVTIVRLNDYLSINNMIIYLHCHL